MREKDTASSRQPAVRWGKCTCVVIVVAPCSVQCKFRVIGMESQVYITLVLDRRVSFVATPRSAPTRSPSRMPPMVRSWSDAYLSVRAGDCHFAATFESRAAQSLEDVSGRGGCTESTWNTKTEPGRVTVPYQVCADGFKRKPRGKPANGRARLMRGDDLCTLYTLCIVVSPRC